MRTGSNLAERVGGDEDVPQIPNGFLANFGTYNQITDKLGFQRQTAVRNGADRHEKAGRTQPLRQPVSTPVD
ncbi:MAG: hypothetical protein ABJX32_08200 [Tateyamaria sp.]|uniref:hypothetical protein n=1 Tax=Tateyamaria sp. TaxID=1929288 RepID=UPI0032A03705